MTRDVRPPWFPFYPDDFVSDGEVEAMSTLAVGAYILLLCKAWRESPPCTVPDDDRKLARWARVTGDDWTAVRDEVLSAWTLRDGRWMQKRLRKEWDRFAEKSSKASKAALRRWKPCDSNADAMRSHCNGNARASDSVSDSSCPAEGGRAEGGGYHVNEHRAREIFAAYPKRVKPARALTAIRDAVRLVGSQVVSGKREALDAHAWLLERVQAFSAAVEGAPKKHLIPDPHNWFGNGQYDDDDTQWASVGRDGATAPADESRPYDQPFRPEVTQQDLDAVESEQQAAREALARLPPSEREASYRAYMTKLRRTVTEIPPLDEWKANVVLAVWNEHLGAHP